MCLIQNDGVLPWLFRDQTKRTQTGTGTSTGSPAGVSRPLAASMSNSVSEFESWFATTSERPQGAMPNLRGV